MKCEMCGKEIERSKYLNAILCSDECFNKHFWKEIVIDKKKYIVVNGECYFDGGDKPNSTKTMWLGFGGRRFWIRFFNGTTMTTNNLWHNGTIPEEFRLDLPDNAEFYIPDEVKENWRNLIGLKTNLRKT